MDKTRCDHCAYVKGHGECHRNFRKENAAQSGGVREGFSAEPTPTLALKSRNVLVSVLQSEENTQSQGDKRVFEEIEPQPWSGECRIQQGSRGRSRSNGTYLPTADLFWLFALDLNASIYRNFSISTLPQLYLRDISFGTWSNLGAIWGGGVDT